MATKPANRSDVLVIYCADYWQRRQPDASYVSEAAASHSHGLATALINFEALTEGGMLTRQLRLYSLPPHRKWQSIAGGC